MGGRRGGMGGTIFPGGVPAGPPENGRAAVTERADGAEIALFPRIFLFHAETVVARTRAGSAPSAPSGHNARSPIGKDVEARDADE